MKLISSYPRSGSAKLRMIICNLLHPDTEHDFESMNIYIPSIDSPNTRDRGVGCEFMVTHMPISSDIFLYRHVGDCLISEYFFKQKFYPSEQSLEQFIVECDYGKEWRKSIEAGRDSKWKISFEDLSEPDILWNLFEGQFHLWKINEALEKSSFENMRTIEDKKGLDEHLPESFSNVKYMRSGLSGQWKNLPKELAHMICNKNEGELAYLELTKWEDGQYVDIR